MPFKDLIKKLGKAIHPARILASKGTSQEEEPAASPRLVEVSKASPPAGKPATKRNRLTKARPSCTRDGNKTSSRQEEQDASCKTTSAKKFVSLPKISRLPSNLRSLKDRKAAREESHNPAVEEGLVQASPEPAASHLESSVAVTPEDRLPINPIDAIGQSNLETADFVDDDDEILEQSAATSTPGPTDQTFDEALHTVQTPGYVVAAAVDGQETRNTSGATQLSALETLRTEASRASTIATSSSGLSHHGSCEDDEQTQDACSSLAEAHGAPAVDEQIDFHDDASPDALPACEPSEEALAFLSGSLPLEDKSSEGSNEMQHLIGNDWEVPMVEEHHDEDDELKVLQQCLEQQESHSQGLRKQLIDREVKLENLNAKVCTLQRERDMFEVESDATEQKLRKMQLELKAKDTELAAQKAKASLAFGQVESNRQVMASESMRQAFAGNAVAYDPQAATREAQQLHATLNLVVAEREELKRRLQSAIKREEDATSLNQTLSHGMEQMNAQIEALNDAVGGFEHQAQLAHQLKEQAEEQNLVLEGKVAALMDDFVAKYKEDPRDIEDPMICKPNELRDLSQTLEMSQAKCVQVIEENNRFAEEIDRQKKEIAGLREENEVVKDSNARLSSSFEMWKSKIDNFMATIPQIVKLETGLSEEEIPGLKEWLAESQLHEELTGAALKDKDLELTRLQTKIVKLGRAREAEAESMSKQNAELQEKTIRLDEANISLTTRLDDSDRTITELKDQLKVAEKLADQWRLQCQQQEYGDAAEILRKEHEHHLQQLTDSNDALLHRMHELHIGREMAEQDLGQFKYWTATSMARVRQLVAWHDWYQAQVEALRERFQKELLVKPLDIPFKSPFQDLTEEQQQDLLRGEDRLIRFFTDVNLDRAGPSRAPQIASADILRPLIQEYVAYN